MARYGDPVANGRASGAERALIDDSQDRFDRLEGEFRIMEARNEAVKSDLKSSLSDMKADFALLREDMAKRETRLLLTVGGLIVTMTALATAILGFLIRLPG